MQEGFSMESRKTPEIRDVANNIQAKLALLFLHEENPDLPINELDPNANDSRTKRDAMELWLAENENGLSLAAQFRDYADTHGNERVDPDNLQSIRDLARKIKHTLH